MTINHDTAATISSTIAIGGISGSGSIGFVAWLTQSATALSLGFTGGMFLVGACGLGVTYYFKREHLLIARAEEHRKQELHDKILDHKPKGSEDQNAS